MAAIQFDIPERFDTTSAEEGRWFDVHGENRRHWGDFKCAMLNNESRTIKLAQERQRTKYARELRLLAGDDAGKEEQRNTLYRKIALEVFLECILLDWRGVTAGGKEVPFTKANAAAYFALESTKYVVDRLLVECQDVLNFQRIDTDEVSGN
ncbi:hypothetical protein [Sphingomonas sp. G-3-2-10]|uniref:hypothetical protein n=1 Tax=Sphingomonas sp. G-3-2-10 TaxID=2728838 RepID=UPI00146C489E|nr:hypothetical protein [Sphingomonas sp. G-3-2-10]NML04269.1 hypothetical protein [Sphingomonas sp. G-3-2-10]